MYTKQELIKLWSNDQKRKEFIRSFKEWGVWLTLPELDLTFYKFDLPDGVRLIAMEHLRRDYNYKMLDKEATYVTGYKLYVQSGAHFCPNQSSEYVVADELKIQKEKLIKELKQTKQM
jgi:hypothetical protein